MTVRVTDLGSINRYINWGQQNRSTIARGERQVATGEKYERPSEAPTEAGTIVGSRNRINRLKQFLRNQDSAGDWLGAADSALQSTTNSLARARTLAIQALNDATTQEGRNAIASELRSVAAEVLSVSNTKVDGRPLFGGTSGADKAFDTDGTYLGDTGVARRRVSEDITLDVGVVGTDVFGTNDAAAPYNGSVFQVLTTLASDLEAGDTTSARVGLDAIKTADDRILNELGRVGAMGSRLEAISDRTRTEEERFTMRLAGAADTDMAEAIVRLRAAEVSHDATLAATSRALNRSLLDFLR